MHFINARGGCLPLWWLHLGHCWFVFIWITSEQYFEEKGNQVNSPLDVATLLLYVSTWCWAYYLSLITSKKLDKIAIVWPLVIWFGSNNKLHVRHVVWVWIFGNQMKLLLQANGSICVKKRSQCIELIPYLAELLNCSEWKQFQIAAIRMKIGFQLLTSNRIEFH